MSGLIHVEFDRELSPVAATAWEAFWNNCRYAHPEQHPLYAQAVRGRGRVPVFVTAREHDRVVATALLSLKPRLPGGRCSLEALCSRGPVFEDIGAGAQLLRSIVAWCQKNLVGSLIIQPNWAYPDAAPLEAALTQIGFSPRSPKTSPREHTGLVRLDIPEEQLLASLSQGTRSHLRRALRWQAEVRPAKKPVELEMFLQRYLRMSHDRGLVPDTRAEVQARFEHFLSAGTLGTLLNAFLDGQFVGGLAMLRSPTIAYAHRYVVVPELLQNLRIGPLLWWEGMQWARRQGLKWFDVSGFLNLPPTSPLYEAYRFKAGFRPTAIEKLPDYRIVCNRAMLQLSRARDLLVRGRRSGSRTWGRLRTALVSRQSIRLRAPAESPSAGSGHHPAELRRPKPHALKRS